MWASRHIPIAVYYTRRVQWLKQAPKTAIRCLSDPAVSRYATETFLLTGAEPKRSPLQYAAGFVEKMRFEVSPRLSDGE